MKITGGARSDVADLAVVTFQGLGVRGRLPLLKMKGSHRLIQIREGLLTLTLGLQCDLCPLESNS